MRISVLGSESGLLHGVHDEAGLEERAEQLLQRAMEVYL